MDADDAEILWQWARVVDDGRGGLALEFEDPACCERCRLGQGCGAGQFARLFRRGDPIRLTAPATLDATPGARVQVGIDGRCLLLGAGSMYLLPVLGFVAAVSAVDALLGGNEPIALLCGLAVAVGNWWVVPWVLQRGLKPGLRLGAVLESGSEGRHLNSVGSVGGCRASSKEKTTE